MKWPVTLETKRLVLRPWRVSDAKALYTHAKDPDVGRGAGWPPHRSVEESAQIIRDVLAAPQSFAITLRNAEDPDAPVGAIGLLIGEDSDLAIGSDQAELVFWIGKPLWGKGYMTEAVRAVMQHAFKGLGLEAIWIGFPESNDKSRRISEKTGFTRQRTIRDRIRTKVGDYETEDVNWITRDEWEIAQRADPVEESYVEAQQREADALVSSVPQIAYIRSGGQTGADRGALDAAREMGVPICGWCPPGGLAEDRPKPPGLLATYPELKETDDEGYVVRTAWNVRDSHATLIVAPAGVEPRSGTEMTIRFAEEYGRPYLTIRSIEELGKARAWLAGLGRGITLNVAGPREIKTPGTYTLTKRIIALLLASAQATQRNARDGDGKA